MMLQFYHLYNVMRLSCFNFSHIPQSMFCYDTSAKIAPPQKNRLPGRPGQVYFHAGQVPFSDENLPYMRVRMPDEQTN